MKNKNQIILFIIIALTCLIAIFTLKAPYRNYVPIAWAFFGFALNSFLYVQGWRKINKRLISDYRELLNSFNITIYKLGWSRIDTYVLLNNKQLESSLDNEMQNKIKDLKLKMKLTIIAFLLYAVFGILTVILASKNS